MAKITFACRKLSIHTYHARATASIFSAHKKKYQPFWKFCKLVCCLAVRPSFSVNRQNGNWLAAAHAIMNHVRASDPASSSAMPHLHGQTPTATAKNKPQRKCHTTNHPARSDLRLHVVCIGQKKITLNQAFTQQITEPRGTPDRSAHAPFMNHWFTPVLFEIQRPDVITKKPIYWQKTMASIQKPCLCNSFSHFVHNLVWHHQGDLRYRSMAADTRASFDTTKCGCFGGWPKQLGFLVRDLPLRFYLVNHKFLPDFSHFFPAMPKGRKYMI